MKVFAAIITLLLPAFAHSQAYCDDFNMTVTSLTFKWQNAIGGEQIVYNSDKLVTWGKPATNKGKSALLAEPRGPTFPFTLVPGYDNLLGTVTHSNMAVWAGGGIDGVQLVVKLVTEYYGTFSFTYDMTVDETPNRGPKAECPYPGTTACADAVVIINDPAPLKLVTRKNITFELDLMGFKQTPTGPIVDRFISDEQKRTSANLYGSLTLVDCPKQGGGEGDPHFETWTGMWYDFQGACDMHLVNAPDFASGLPLTIDVRTRIRRWYSYIESAVVKIGHDTLEVASFGEYFLNGVEGAQRTGDFAPKTIGGFPILHVRQDKNITIIEIALDGKLVHSQEKIVIRSNKDMVAIKIANANRDRFYGSSGLMGDFRNGHVYSRDGRTVLQDPLAIANEWQVRGDEPMLFQAALAPQFPQRCQMPTREQPKTGRLGNTIALEAARTACAHWSVRARELCVQDVMKTGDFELAEVGAL